MSPLPPTTALPRYSFHTLLSGKIAEKIGGDSFDPTLGSTLLQRITLNILKPDMQLQQFPPHLHPRRPVVIQRQPRKLPQQVNRLLFFTLKKPPPN